MRAISSLISSKRSGAHITDHEAKRVLQSVNLRLIECLIAGDKRVTQRQKSAEILDDFRSCLGVGGGPRLGGVTQQANRAMIGIAYLTIE